MLTELPEKWKLKCKNKQEQEIFVEWVEINKQTTSNYRLQNLVDFLFHYPAINGNTHTSSTNHPDYTEISFEDFKRLVLKEEKMEILKEDQKVELFGISYTVERAPNGEYFLEGGPKSNCQMFEDAGIGRTSKVQFQEKILGYQKGGGFPQCKSLEDLTKLVQAIKDYKMNKKIIGYKAPMDLFEGEVKKGTIYNGNPKEASSQKPNTYWIKDNFSTKYNLPKEIVETWEPVYESQKLNKVGVHDVSYLNKTTVKIGCTEYTKSQLKGAEMLLETKNIKYIMCDDDTKIDIGIIRQLIQGLES